MYKRLKIAVNLVIFLLFAGFAWYMIVSIKKDGSLNYVTIDKSDDSFVSPYKQVTSFDLPEEINRFDLYNGKLFISVKQSVYIYDTEANLLGDFLVEPDVRDIAVQGDNIYLLYPTSIVVLSFDGLPVRQWEACSELSDYCSFTIVGDYVFVTDVENKNICKYTTNGDFVTFIRSPNGFIIPSYSFDIDSWNDTIYCANSGRHQIETYTLSGEYITSFGSAGTEPGSFAGCCNPVYISFTQCGKLITSEKGNPRISVFQRYGQFETLWLNNKKLNSGNKASEVRSYNDKLFVAQKNSIIVYH